MSCPPGTLVGVGGTRIWTCDAGAGALLLLANGGPGCCDGLQAVADELLPECRVLRFEQRGCGRSDPAGPFDLATCIADIEAIRAAAGIERWIVGGHSWGADLALGYALTHPGRCRGLLLLAGGRIHDDRSWSEEYRRQRDAGNEIEPACA